MSWNICFFQNHTPTHLRKHYVHLSKACQDKYGFTLFEKFPELKSYIERIKRVDKKHLEQLSSMSSIPKATRMKDDKEERRRENFWNRW